ncbi:YciI family protein [Propionibacterium sp.]|uniref:YciI family protein n=1 Tax=Propionibacterium sp. TaxID=1977903 RepID=UPI0039E89C38
MPQYLFSVHATAKEYNSSSKYGSYGSEEEMRQAMADTQAFNKSLEADDYLIFAGGLEPPEAAKTVDGQGTEAEISDGPVIGGDIHLSGFWVISAPTSDAALKLAAEASKACRSAVEVRPFNEFRSD